MCSLFLNLNHRLPTVANVFSVRADVGRSRNERKPNVEGMGLDFVEDTRKSSIRELDEKLFDINQNQNPRLLIDIDLKPRHFTRV